MPFRVKLLALQFLFTAATALGSQYEGIGLFANTTIRPISGRLDDLALSPRQFQCEVPGGPQCSATTCCRPGERCCPNGCCDDDENCFGSNKCCPKVAETCGGKTCCETGAACCSSSPTGCCKGGWTCCKSTVTPCCPAGATCCGDTCCLSGETCEQGECVNSNALNSGKIARFQYNKEKNGCLLANMCSGMRGKNTIELTYSGDLSKSEKAAKRRQGGCTKGYCASLNQPGLDSCEEFPPVSSDEGILSSPKCIPGIQNSLQGNILNQMVQKSKIQKGDTFIISAPCNQIAIGSCSIKTVTREIARSGIAGVVPRDEIESSGSTTVDSLYNSSLSGMSTGNVIILPYDDLGPEQYASSIQVISGSVSGSFIIDNLGDSYAQASSAATLGESQQLSFSVEDGGALMGVGMILTTSDPTTRVKWSFEGKELASGSSDGSNTAGGGSTSGSGSGSSSGGSNGGIPSLNAANQVVVKSWFTIAAVGGVILFIRLATY